MSALKEIFSSRARAEIFRLLFSFPERNLHLREIERRSGLAVRAVSRELKKLEKLGLVQSDQDGNRLYYRANQEHPLFPDIRNLVLKTSGLVDVLRGSLKNLSIQFAFVFGSLARATETATSDIDLLVVGNVTLRRLTRALAGVPERLSREINPALFTTSEFKDRVKRQDHFLKSVLESPRIFVVGTEDDLKAMAG